VREAPLGEAGGGNRLLFLAVRNSAGGSGDRVLRVARCTPVCNEMVYLRNLLVCLWRDCSGSSLIEYSFLITITIVLVVVGVALAGRWAANTWIHLLPALPP
jgi:Flp pilus assembly pilin Flp